MGGVEGGEGDGDCAYTVVEVIIAAVITIAIAQRDKGVPPDCFSDPATRRILDQTRVIKCEITDRVHSRIWRPIPKKPSFGGNKADFFGVRSVIKLPQQGPHIPRLPPTVSSTNSRICSSSMLSGGSTRITLSPAATVSRPLVRR